MCACVCVYMRVSLDYCFHFLLGITAAMLGSLPSNFLYFGSYEFAKRTLLPFTTDHVAHLIAGYNYCH